MHRRNLHFRQQKQPSSVKLCLYVILHNVAQKYKVQEVHNLLHLYSFIQKCCIKYTVVVESLHTYICKENVSHGSFQSQ